MNQEHKKEQAAIKAIEFIPKNEIIGVGTGTTVNYFIKALDKIKHNIKGAVSTSKQSTELLKGLGIKIFNLHEIDFLPVYVDGADQINESLHMIKGKGGALLAEKIVASISNLFICIADDSKYVKRLGVDCSVPVEVIPYSRTLVSKKLLKFGGMPELRLDFITERDNQILDVSDLDLSKPMEMEEKLNRIPGVVENGIFANNPADILILAKDNGIDVIKQGIYDV